MRRALPAAVALLLLGIAAYIALHRRADGAAPGTPPPATGTPGTAPATGAGAGTGTGAGTGAKAAPPARTAAAFAKGQVVVDGKWGSKPGEFGRRRDPESNPEGPMAMATLGNGELAIVDQVNRRVQRWKDGKPAGSVATGGDTVQDIAVAPDGRTVLLDRLADRNVQVYDSDGKLANETELVGKNVPEGGGVTGVFADDQGIYVEREHGAVVRIADARGNADRDRPELPGRPTRDGRLFVAAQLLDRAAGTVMVRAADRATGQPAWQQEVALGAPILQLLLLDSDRNGMVYVAAVTGREGPEPPYPILDEAIVVARLGAGGAPRGTLALPPMPTEDETFRPLTVDDAGNIYAMVLGPNGVQVVRYSF